MAIERPKLLTMITVPSAGYAVRFTFNSTAVNFTIPAGNYYMAGDGQADDFLYTLCSTFQAAARALGGGLASALCTGSIDTDHKTQLAFSAVGTGNGTLHWTVNDGATVAKILGYDHTADDTVTIGSTKGFINGDYHHAYGWYADEDGYLSNKSLWDVPEQISAQIRSLTGAVKTLRYSDIMYRSGMSLFAMTEAKTWSDGAAYTEAPNHYEYNRNEALECWYMEASKGTPFRVYRNHGIAQARATPSIAITTDVIGATTYQITDPAVSWTTDQYKGWTMYSAAPGGSADNKPLRWYISSNTSDTLTISDWTGAAAADSNEVRLFDERYKTYVLDSGASSFSVEEMRGLNRFSTSIPLLKYVA